MDSDPHCSCCNFKRPRHVKSSLDYSLLHVTKNSLHRSYFRPTPSARLLSLGTIPLIRRLWYYISLHILGTSALRLQYTFRSIIFFKSGFWGQNIDRTVIFNLWKDYWKRLNIGGEIAVLRLRRASKSLPLLIDSSVMLCNQPRRLSPDYTDVKNWLPSYSVDQPPSIFLDVIILGMNN